LKQTENNRIMKKHFYFILATIAFITTSAQNIVRTDKGDCLANTIIVKVKPSYKSICENNTIGNTLFSSYATALGVTNLHKKFPLDKSPKEQFNSAGQAFADLSLIYELNYSSNISIEKAINKLMATGILIYAEPHMVPKSLYAPNDPLGTAGSQYHLLKINAFNAWNINKGDSSIVIGITDTGTEPNHPDLFNAIKRNYGDVVDGIDNDGDGYVDNYKGWDLGMNDNDATYQANAHGVHVSGISAASTDNTIGGAGVGFNCKFLPVKISDASGNLIKAYEGIKYAADHGCTVINCSWGGGGATVFGQDMVTYASINKSCLVVAAAGNNGIDGEFYPAAYNYVIAVANTTSGDVKHSSSNYGYFVDVAAPGDNINSTWTGSSYSLLTGTSMSSPVVAGAAGIVKKQFPSYNGLQIGERLKVTADNIYSVNPSYINKLGTGRINLFRALNDPATPSVVFTNKMVTDHNDESFISGDTLFITGTFINYLDPTTALNVTVTPLSALATVIDKTTTLGVINTLASKTNSLDPFTFKLTGVIPINQAIDFEVLIQDGAYQSKQYFTLNVNVDYINITNNDVLTTATSRGRIGYNQDGQIQGLGFNYKGTGLMYDAGLMIGKDSSKVSDCVRNTTGSTNDNDFSVMTRIAKQITMPFSDFDTKAKMNDNLALSPLNIQVDQNTFSWSTAPNTQFVIWEYYIKNTHATDTIKKMFAGIFADWDIDGGTFTQNRSNYNTATKMGYSFYTGASGKYAGIKLLTSSAPPNFYAIDNLAGGAGGVDASSGGFDTKEKYKTLSTQRLIAGATGVGSDVLNVMSSGPFIVPPNQTVKVAFALIAGDSLAGLISAANQAQIKYDGMVTTTAINNFENEESVLIYPNPTNNLFNISQTNTSFNLVEIYSLSGTLIYKSELSLSSESIDMTGYSKGMYLVKLSNAKKSIFKKIVLAD
jgi:serine protease